MKKILLLSIFLQFSLNGFSQLNINWINHFCCFDSIAPHSFSVPIGKIFNGDSLILCYWQDSTYRIKKIDLATGNDFTYHNFSTYTFPEASYYGGDFFRLNNRYVMIGSGYQIVNSTTFATLLSDQNFNINGSVSPGWNPGVIHSRAAYSENDSSFVYAVKGDTAIEVVWQSFKDLFPAPNLIFHNITNHDEVKLFPNIYSTSVNRSIASTNSFSGSLHTFLRLNFIDTNMGYFQASQVYLQSAGDNHQLVQMGDTLICVFTDSVSSAVSFVKISLIDMQGSAAIATPVSDIYGVKSIEVSPDSQFIYVRTGETFTMFNRDLSLVYTRSITGSSFDTENKSTVVFDNDMNPVIGYSFVTNQVSNEDLLFLRLSKTDGATLDSLHYADVRNTADHLLEMFRDPNGNLNVIYSSDYDTMFILAEETQISVMQLGGNGLLGIKNPLNKKAVEVYPNPCSDFLSVDAEDLPMNYEIYNQLGQFLCDGRIDIRGESIPTQKLSNGFYFVKLSDQHKTYRLRFIKQN